MKFDFKNPMNLLRIEGWARDGEEDRQIAKRLHYTDTYFCDLKNRFSELSEALNRGRQPLDVLIENSLYKRAMGLKVKTVTKRWLTLPDGTQTDTEIIQEVTTELPPDVGALAYWLKNRKPDGWNKQPTRVDSTTNGNDIGGGIVIEIIDSTTQVKDDEENPSS